MGGGVRKIICDYHQIVNQFGSSLGHFVWLAPEVIKLFSYSGEHQIYHTHNVKMPTFVGILTFISRINVTYMRDLKQETSSFVGILVFMSS